MQLSESATRNAKPGTRNLNFWLSCPAPGRAGFPGEFQHALIFRGGGVGVRGDFFQRLRTVEPVAIEER